MSLVCDICETPVSNTNMYHHKKSEKCKFIKSLLDKRSTELKNTIEQYEKIIEGKNNEIKNTIEQYSNMLIEKDKQITKLNCMNEILRESKTSNDKIEYKNLKGKNLVLNGVEVIYRPSDGYFNVSKLCKAGGKVLGNWKSTDSSMKILNVISASVGMPIDALMVQEKGDNHNRDTWAHRLVAIHIAQWISPEFSVKVSLLGCQ